MLYYILRYGEIALKSKNRHIFENKLKNNILQYLKNKYELNAKIFAIRGRMILEVEKQVDLRPIFGLISYSEAMRTEKDIEIIKQVAIEEFEKTKKPKTFKIETHRLNKSFHLKSPEINMIIGEVIHEKFNIPADMSSPELVIGIEIHNDYSYVYTTKVKCFGGLPVGSAEKVAIKITENNNRNILSALNLMKRGCKILLIGKIVDTNLVKLFNNFHEPKFVKLEDLNKMHISTIAFPENMQNINKISKDNFLMLYPLALLSDKEVETELKEYEI